VYQLPPETAARAATDDVALAEEQVRWFQAVGREDRLKEAQRALAEAQRQREEALPPKERLAGLRARLTEAEDELEKRERAVANTELEIDHLEFRLRDEREAVVDQDARVRSLHHTIEAVELQIPPDASQTGGQGPPVATPEVLTQHLMQVQAIIYQLQGGDLGEEAKAAVVRNLQMLDALGASAARARRERQAQEDSDARMARALQEQEQDSSSDVDATGEHDFIEVQYRGKSKKGKGNGKAWNQATGSPTVQSSGRQADIGPLATTATRTPPAPPPPPTPLAAMAARAASEPRGRGLERHRSPRRAPTGTPAQPGAEAAGTLGEAKAKDATSPTEQPSEPPAGQAGPQAGAAAGAAASPTGAGATPTGSDQAALETGDPLALNARGGPVWT
jgi:hypothetical protein